MAKVLDEISRTFDEFLLIPRYSSKEHLIENVSLKTSVVKFKKGSKSPLEISTPMVSAVMQSVSGDKLGIALAKEGGISFIFGNQSIESQVKMVKIVKSAKVEQSDLASLDSSKSYICGAGINTRDYKDRVPALVEAGVDILVIDSSEGFNEFQKETLEFIHSKYKNKVFCGAGNVVSKEGFDYLAKCGADFVKVGIGGGSICTTRETKGIGRGQASALLEISKARDDYFKKTGIYIPICSDGGIVRDHHITLALAMGADFIMLGRYFAGCEESPSKKVKIGKNYFKEYWGEGSNKARNWQRYDMGKKTHLSFEEGVDSLIPYKGKLKDNIGETIAKVKSTFCNCGSLNIKEFQSNAILTIVSETSIKEGSAHDVIVKGKK